MNHVVPICVSFIVALLAIAYPILFQVVSRLDEKYSSILITDILEKERDKKLFIIFLYTSLASILIWSFNIPPLIRIYGLNFLIENSATLLLLISTILLIVYFFRFVDKILIYYSPIKFLKYLINKHSITSDDEFVYFKAISDVLYFSIKNQNERVAKTVSDFMYKAFSDYRDNSPIGPIEYPHAYYEVVYKSTEELAVQNNKKLAFLEVRTVGGVWLLGEIKDYPISETTFSWLWRNLQLALKYERDDMVIYYWEKAHQFFSYRLQQIRPIYSKDYRIENEKDIEERKIQKERFLEFHYAFGGLLLYKQRHKCLGRIFKYTTSIPPKYELLPESMNEVFNFYFQFRDPYGNRKPWISQRYYFPELEGLHADGVIKGWICRYIAVLFIRQYSIIPHLIYMKPLEMPTIPGSQNEKKQWIDNLNYFVTLVETVYIDHELKSHIGLKFFDDKWCEDNKKPKPLELIKKVKATVIKSFEDTKIEQSISQVKVQEFYDSSLSLLRGAISEYKSIINTEDFEEEFSNWYVYGERTIVDKSAFAENQETDHLDFDSFLAGELSRKFKDGVSETFFHNKSSSYLLKPKDIFLAIDRMKTNGEEYLIICFGIDIQYLVNTYQLDELSEKKYKDIEIISFSGFNHHLVGGSLFILKKADLPRFKYIEISADEIEKYSLKRLDKDFNIYASIIDLNQFKELQDEFAESASDRDLRKSVLLNISMITEIRWKKSVNMISLRLFYDFEERGVPNQLKDIKEIE